MSNVKPETIRLLEQALQQGEAQFRALADTLSEGVFICQGTRFDYLNPACGLITGYSQKELLGMNFYDLIPEARKKQVRTCGLSLQRGKVKPQRQELPIYTKEGEERWIELIPSLTQCQGKPAILGCVIDITEVWRARKIENVMLRLAQAAQSAPTLEELFSSIYAIVEEIISIELFGIGLKHSSDAWTYPYLIGEIDSGWLSQASQYILTEAQPVVFTPQVWKELSKPGEDQPEKPPTSFWFGSPLTCNQQVIGVMVCGARRPYQEQDRRLLELAARQAEMALSLFQFRQGGTRSEESDRQQPATNFAALYEATRDLTLQRNLGRLLGVIVEHTTNLLHSSGCAIYLYNHDREELEVAETRGPWMLGDIAVKMGEDLVGTAAETRQLIIAKDYRPLYPSSSSPMAYLAVSVPLVFGGELIGALLVYEVDSGETTGSPSRRDYNQSELDLLTFFAGVASSALHNAILFEETRQRLLELEVLYQASLAAAQIHSVRAVAQRVVEALEQLMNWQTSIWILDAEQNRPLLLAHGGDRLPRQSEKMKTEIAYLSQLIPSIYTGIVGWVCRTGQTVRANDVRSDPRYVAGNEEVRSELCVPLKVGGRIIGCINVESPRENAFSEHDERLLTTLANQAAIAMENARLFEETRKRAMRQSALNAIIMAATRAESDFDAFLNMTLDQTLQALDSDVGALWLTASADHLHRVAVRGIPISLANAISQETLTQGQGSRQKPIINNWKQQTGPLADLLESIGIVSSIIVPLLLDGQEIGGLAIAASQPRRWTEEEIALVEAVGREVGAVAERARLFEETRARLSELESVNRVSTALRLAHSLDDMLPNLVEETIRTLNAQAGGIWLRDVDSGKLQLVFGRGWVARLANLGTDHEDGIAGAVFANSDVYFAHEIATDPLLSWRAREIVPAGWSALYVPIRTEGGTIGVFMVTDQLPREFSVGDARLIVTLAEMAGNAIQRMRLHEQTQRHAMELEQRVQERTAELQNALKKAQEADRLKSEFIANVNHELRTPLTNLMLYYQMLRAQPTTRTEERLDVIGRELQRLRTLIEDLLSLSRMESGQTPFSPKWHNLNHLLHSLVEDRRPLAEERGLTLSLHLNQDLPLVSLDEPMIGQALSNLLTNALNYTPRGGEVRICTMHTQRDDVSLVGFSVQDTGPGISDEDKEHIFERFYRGQAGHQSGAPGTGLGLAIVKQIVDRHKGTIEVENGKIDGKGASFTIWLPVEQ